MSEIYLDTLGEADAELLLEWSRDEKNVDFYNPKGTLEQYQNYLKNLRPQDKYFKIVDKETGTGLGTVSLYNVSRRNNSAMLGVMIGAETNRGHGLGAEAIRQVLNYGFNECHFHSIYLYVDADNLRGIRCYEKVGFQKTGSRREAIRRGDKYIDKVSMDILEDEWREISERA